MLSFKRSGRFVAAVVVIGLMTAASVAQAAGTPAAQGLFNGTPAGGTAYHFTTVQFLSGSIGRAAGNGFIIGTSDAGSSWQSIYKGTWQFSQLDFISNTTGWALAKSSNSGPNALIYTKDGGKTFNKIPMGSINLTRVHFTNVHDGFGYTNSSAYQTSDGGESWTKIPTPANTRYSEFTDTKHGWALVVVPGYGYELSRTTNGGATWSKKLSVKTVAGEATGGEIYTSGNQVWVELYGGAGMSQQSYSLYASPDNGDSWRKVINQETAGGGPAPGGATGVAQEGPASPGGHPSNLELVDGAAILGGYSPAGGVIGVGSSLDVGKSWTNFKPITGYESVISFTSKKLGWMADTSSLHPAIYRTNDGGKSWSEKISIPMT